MKKERVYFGVLLAIFAFLVWGNMGLENDPWERTYERGDSRAYGSQVLYELLPQVFDGAEVLSIDIPPYLVLSDDDHQKVNYLFITNVFTPDETESEALLNFVEAGNVVFIAAQSISGHLADTLGVWTELEFDRFNTLSDTTGRSEGVPPRFIPPLAPSTFKGPNVKRINFTNKSLAVDNGYFYSDKEIYTSLAMEEDAGQNEDLEYTILGTFQDASFNFIKVDIGEGFFLLSSTPLAFTNFNMLLEEAPGSYGAAYAFKALSYLPVQKTLWDRYYKPGNLRDSTPLSFVLSSEALRMAYYTILAAIVLFMLVRARRMQRIIPVLQAKENRTVEFAQTVGRLYFNQANHCDLAYKMTDQFRRYLNDHLNLPLTGESEYPVEKIAARAGVPVGELSSLVSHLNLVKKNKSIDAETLQVLAGKLDLFYSRSKR